MLTFQSNLNYHFIKVSILLCICLIPNHAFSGQLTENQLNKLVKKAQRKSGSPAMAFAIIQSDNIRYGISGNNKKGNKSKVDLDHKFHLGSNSKGITSYIAMKLVEKGNLSLDTSLFQLFPELTNDKFKHVTLGDFLMHRSKVMPFMNSEFRSLPFKGTVSEKRYQLAKYLFKKKPLKKSFNYSNAGYVMAALMLEKATSKTYEELLTSTMNDLGLSFYIGFPNKENKGNPWGHQLENGRLRPIKSYSKFNFSDYMVSAGDISMSITDYAKFIQLHLNGLRGEENYLTKKTYEKLHYGLKDYAYGWSNKTDDKLRSTSHFGSLGTYYCYTIIIEKADLAVVFMLNSIGSKQVKESYKLAGKIIELLYE